MEHFEFYSNIGLPTFTLDPSRENQSMKFSFSIRSEFEIPSIARTGLRTPDGHVCVSLSSAHDQCDQIGATFVGRFLGSKLSYKNAQMLSKVLDYFVKCHFFSKNCCSCILGNFFWGGNVLLSFQHLVTLSPLDHCAIEEGLSIMNGN